jgi:hypothetical protein
MILPKQSPAILRPSHIGVFETSGDSGVTPQQRVCTPCIRLPSGRHCVNLPIVGRRCFNIPSLGSWRLCCQLRIGWPPISCGISRC